MSEQTRVNILPKKVNGPEDNTLTISSNIVGKKA